MSFCRRLSLSFLAAAIIAAAAFVQAQNSAGSDMPASHQMQQSQQSADSNLPVPQDFQTPEQGALVAAADIARDPADVARPVGSRAPQIVKVALTAQELEGKLDPAMKTTYQYWLRARTAPCGNVKS
jgi:hypothetical protein